MALELVSSWGRFPNNAGHSENGTRPSSSEVTSVSANAGSFRQVENQIHRTPLEDCDEGENGVLAGAARQSCPGSTMGADHPFPSKDRVEDKRQHDDQVDRKVAKKDHDPDGSFLARMPKKPITAYNTFFQLERQSIMESCLNMELPDGDDGDGDDDDDDDDGCGGGGLDLAIFAKRSKTFTEKDLEEFVEAQRIKNGENKPKRKHRRTHKKIDFSDLAREVAKRWKMISDEEKAIFDRHYEAEKRQYELDLAAWSEEHGHLAQLQLPDSNVSDPLPKNGTGKKRKGDLDRAPKSNGASSETLPPFARSNTSDPALSKSDCVTPVADESVSATPPVSPSDNDQDGSSQPSSRMQIQTRERNTPTSLGNNHISSPKILNLNPVPLEEKNDLLQPVSTEHRRQYHARDGDKTGNSAADYRLIRAQLLEEKQWQMESLLLLRDQMEEIQRDLKTKNDLLQQGMDELEFFGMRDIIRFGYADTDDLRFKRRKVSHGYGSGGYRKEARQSVTPFAHSHLARGYNGSKLNPYNIQHYNQKIANDPFGDMQQPLQKNPLTCVIRPSQGCRRVSMEFHGNNFINTVDSCGPGDDGSFEECDIIEQATAMLDRTRQRLRDVRSEDAMTAAARSQDALTAAQTDEDYTDGQSMGNDPATDINENVTYEEVDEYSFDDESITSLTHHLVDQSFTNVCEAVQINAFMDDDDWKD